MKLSIKGRMKAGPSKSATPEQLLAEYQSHLNTAQDYLRKALEAEATEAPGASVLFAKAQIEQNAALLCQGRAQMVMTGTVVALLAGLIGEDDEAEERAVN